MTILNVHRVFRIASVPMHELVHIYTQGSVTELAHVLIVYISIPGGTMLLYNNTKQYMDVSTRGI